MNPEITQEEFEKSSRELMAFIGKSPTCFQVAGNIAKILKENGFTELRENERWKIVPGNGYFVTRNGSAVISFFVPEKYVSGFRIIASHSDAPTFKIKNEPEMDFEGKYVKLNVEGYGGMLMAPWFDRPLSAAGRVSVLEDGKIVTKDVIIDRDLVMIVNLAIHMNREANSGYKYNVQKDLLPLYGASLSKGSFMKLIADAAGVREEDILSHDLFLYNRMPGTVWGAENEFISCARLDDVQCAWTSLQGFLSAKKDEHICVHAVFDNEEVGSGTKQGAGSTFLYDVLTRLNRALGGDEEDYHVHVADSFLLSADNGHAVHPNYPEKADPVNRPVMNGGVLLKFAGNQKYCTDAVSAGFLRNICKEAGVPCQAYVNRSDIPGGSTLGNISTSQVSVSSADIGLAQLAMHSPYETGGVKDTEYMIRAARTFYR